MSSPRALLAECSLTLKAMGGSGVYIYEYKHINLSLSLSLDGSFVYMSRLSALLAEFSLTLKANPRLEEVFRRMGDGGVTGGATLLLRLLEKDQQVTHTHTDREQHPRHRHTRTRQAQHRTINRPSFHLKKRNG